MSGDDTPVVLLVEDEPFVRMWTADVLTDGGFFVLQAQDAEEALSIAAYSPRLDPLFTDINLGQGLDGMELSRLVRARRPGTKLVITSGRERVPVDDLPDTTVFLPKPYRTERVCELLRAQLAR